MDYSFDFTLTENNSEYISSYLSMDKIFELKPNSSNIDKSKNDDSLLFIKSTGINKDRPLKKLNIPQAILIML